MLILWSTIKEKSKILGPENDYSLMYDCEERVNGVLFHKATSEMLQVLLELLICDQMISEVVSIVGFARLLVNCAKMTL